MASDVSVSGGKLNTPVGDAPIIPLFAIGFGLYLLWFGSKYWRGAGAAQWPSYPIKSVLQGKGLPAPEPASSVDAQLTAYETAASGAISPGGGPGPGGTVAGSAVATDALRYQGVKYVWGGANPTTGWDCSGMVNWVVGHDLSQPIPGGGAGVFDGAQHGPDVASWLTTPLCHTVLAPQAGDLACWGPNAHMGICISATQMISALNPALGTRITTIPAAHSGPAIFRRLVSTASPATGAGGAGGAPANTARLLLGKFGWSQQEFSALQTLWGKDESGWNPDARNPNSGALGIAQALGHGQGSATAGTLGNEYGAQYGLTAEQARQANSGNVLQQIRWGLGYIKARYGTPSGALAHEKAHGWY
jgi:cell wall-associated NlpC family hydrolase